MTEDGEVECETVVVASGMWTRQLCAPLGVPVPLQACEHYYMITDDFGVDPDLPVFEDPSRYTYIRPEGRGLLVGLFEPDAAPWSVGGIAQDFAFGEIEPDWDRVTPHFERALNRVPSACNVGVSKMFCGPESFTPDLAPYVGPSAQFPNLFLAAGLNSIGILSGPGLGRLLASWIEHGEPDLDVTGMIASRAEDFQLAPQYLAARTAESLGRVYACHYPTFVPETGRDVRRSPFHDDLAAAGACFRDVSGWESPEYFGSAPRTHTFGRPECFETWAAEHEAVRTRVAAIDMSFMAKFRVAGPTAGKDLNFLCTADVDGPCERITYTQWLSETGKVQADVTVAKLATNDFLVIVTDTQRSVAKAYLDAQLGATTAVDVTAAYAMLTVQGPRSRAVLEAIAPGEDWSDSAFPFRTSKWVSLGSARVLVSRLTYVGELGYELLIPTEQARGVLRDVRAAGETEELALAGLRALGSLRLEKGYRDYGHDVDNLDTLLEAGLGFTADFNKPGSFRGAAALAAEKEKGTPQNRLVQVKLLDPAEFLHHGEVLLRGGRPIGEVRSGSYGHTLGGAVGLAMVEAEAPVTAAFLREADWAVDIGGRQVACTVSLRPMYDAKNERIRV
jgi:4-methylaminobutanoate oxidase (formaldehyde-forming)